MNENNQTPSGQQPPYGQQSSNNNAQPPYGQQPPYNNAQPPYGQQPSNNNAQPPYGQQPPYNNPQQPYYGQRPPYSPLPPYYARPLTNNARLFSILAYLGPLWIIGLAADHDNPHVRYHVNQGIILFIFECIFGVANRIIKAIFEVIFMYGAFSLADSLVGIIRSVIWLLTLIFIIIGIVHAAQDREEPLPIIGTLFTIVR